MGIFKKRNGGGAADKSGSSLIKDMEDTIMDQAFDLANDVVAEKHDRSVAQLGETARRHYHDDCMTALDVELALVVLDKYLEMVNMYLRQSIQNGNEEDGKRMVVTAGITQRLINKMKEKQKSL